MPGTYVFKPIEANLSHDTDWLGNMDPYCAYMINNKRIKGQICKEGGMHPFWSEAVTVPIEVDQPACVVELMDKDKILPDDSIGTFVIDLTEVKNKGLVSRWYPIYHKNKPAGEILFETVYQPEFQQGINIEPAFVATPLITETQPVIQETIITEKVVERPVMSNISQTTSILGTGTPTIGIIDNSKATHTVYHSTITSHELAHSGTGCLEDNLYGKTVGVTSIQHVGGTPYQSTHLGHTNLTSQPLGTQSGHLNQPLGDQFNQGNLGVDPNLNLNRGLNQGNLPSQGFNQGFNQGNLPSQGFNQGFNQGNLPSQGFSQGNLQQNLPGQSVNKDNLPL